MAELVVYELVDPRTGATFYVGRGRSARAYRHLRSARNWVRRGRPAPGGSENLHKLRKIAKILASGAEHTVSIVAEGLSFDGSCELERERIALHGLENLTNHAEGGDGPGNHSAASRKRMSKAHKGVPKSEAHKRAIGDGRRGKRHTAAAKAKMAAAQRGRRHSDEHRRKNAEARRGRKRSAETRRRISEGQRGRRQSDGTKARLSAYRLGRSKYPQVVRTCSECGAPRPHGQRKLPSGALIVLPRCVECQRDFTRARKVTA